MKVTRVFSIMLLAAIVLSIAYGRRAVFAGGGISDKNSEVYQTFIDLAAKVSSNPVILVCTGASAATDADENAQFYIDLLTKTYGAKKVYKLPIDLNHPKCAYDQANINLIDSAHGLYFGGGDQSRLYTLFFQNTSKGKVDTPALAKIRQLYESDKLVLAGSSAGTAIMQSTPMVTGGLSYDALVYDPHPYIDDKYPNDLSYQEDGGFGFFTMGFLDTHVGTRGRQGRDIRLVHWFPSTLTNLSFGVDEDSAIVLQNDTFEVVGYNGVFIYDISEATSSKNQSKYWNLANSKVSYLTTGDKYDFRSNKVTFASWKKDISGRERHNTPMSPRADIFCYNTDELFTNVTVDLFDSKGPKTYGTSYQTSPEYRVDFEKKKDSKGAVGTKGRNEYISYTNLYVSIYTSKGSLSDEDDIIVSNDITTPLF
jgi:cyanophycinase